MEWSVEWRVKNNVQSLCGEWRGKWWSGVCGMDRGVLRVECGAGVEKSKRRMES